MNDYISREEAVEMFQNLAYDDWNQGAGTTWANAYSEAAEMIEHHIPAADVRPVVRGHWIFDRGDLATCSNCGSEILKRDVRNHRFCHYCGANMRGKKDGTDDV